MKSRYCPIMRLHQKELAVDAIFKLRPGFAKSSAIRYSCHGFKSHRRLDSSFREIDIEELKFNHRISGNTSGVCLTC